MLRSFLTFLIAVSQIAAFGFDDEALEFAIKENDLALVERQIQSREFFDALADGRESSRLLNYAVRFSDYEVVEILLDAGAESNEWFRPLSSAVKQNRFRVAKLLINRGADVLYSNSREGQEDPVEVNYLMALVVGDKQYRSRGDRKFQYKGEDKGYWLKVDETPLSALEWMEYLASNGSDPLLPDGTFTPLLVLTQDPVKRKWLTDRGAKLDEIERYHFEQSVYEAFNDALRRLDTAETMARFEQILEMKSVHSQLMMEHMSILQGTEYQYKNYREASDWLTKAYWLKAIVLSRLLLDADLAYSRENGGSPHLIENHSYGPLERLISAGDREAVQRELVIQKSQDQLIHPGFVGIAYKAGFQDIAEDLIGYGLNFGRLDLDYLAQQRRMDAVEFIFTRLSMEERQEVVRPVDALFPNNAAFWYAIAGGFHDLLEQMLEHGADPNLKSGEMTPLKLAREKNDKVSEKILIAYGALDDW